MPANGVQAGRIDFSQVEDGDYVTMRAEPSHGLRLAGYADSGHLVQALGLDEGKGDVSVMEMAGISEGPANPYLVQALFTSGDPHLIQEFNGDDNDFANFRWDPLKMNRTVTPQTMGYTMIKEIIWAKSFGSDVEGPNPMNHFRALAMSTEAAAQAQFAVTNLKALDGLFVSGWQDGQIIDSSISAQDQMVMLWALSELSDYINGGYGWYAAPLPGDQARALADDLLFAIENYSNNHPDFLMGLPPRDLGVALSSLSTYANYAQESVGRSLAVEKLIPQLSNELIDRMDNAGRLTTDGRFSQVATQAAAINGLVLENKVTGEMSIKDTALTLWDYMDSLWDETAGVYTPSPNDTDYTYYG